MTSCACGARLSVDGHPHNAPHELTCRGCDAEICTECAAVWDPDFDVETDGTTDCSTTQCRACVVAEAAPLLLEALREAMQFNGCAWGCLKRAADGNVHSSWCTAIRAAIAAAEKRVR